MVEIPDSTHGKGRTVKRAPGKSVFVQIIKHFSPLWWTESMSTGVISIVLHPRNFNFPFRGLGIISDIFFIYNVFIFILFTISFILKIFFSGFKLAFNYGTNELPVLAAFPVALATIIDMICLTCVQSWGMHWGYLAYILWWIDVSASLAAAYGVYYTIFERKTDLAIIKPTFLLPVIAVLTAAAAGGVVGSFSGLPYHVTEPVIIVSFMLLGLGLGLAFVKFICL